MDVASWLRSLGLERYEATFRENAVSVDVLCHLTAEDLKELGVSAVGHRRELLVAIAKLREDAAPPQEIKSTDNRRASISAERRQITVLFCDIVGSTPLSIGLDPEELREILTAYQAKVGAAVTGERGYIARFVGDGVLAYFGWPNPDEAHAESAVRAGLAIIEAVGPQRLSVRIGIATGLVVTGDLTGVGAAQTMTAVGETPNLAARLQALAQPNTVVVSEATRTQLGHLFELEDLGPQTLKGFETPVRPWRVLGKTAAVSRSEVVYATALTSLVGRDEELGQLLRRWREAKAGEGRVVLLSGEPGIGKSRLLAALEERLTSEPRVSLRYFCSPHHQDSPLYPVIARLEREAGFTRGDTVAARLAKLEVVLAPTAPPPEDVALLAALLSIPTDGRYPVLELSPQQRRIRTVAALVRRLAGLARQVPVPILFEDAHWSDPSSLELLDAVIQQVPDLPVLLVVSFRPEFVAPWFGRPRVSLMALSRLDRRDATALAAQIVKDHFLASRLLDRIAIQSDGVPLFIEELTKSVLETPELDTASATLAVPNTLQASLMARLDRLPAAKIVAQIGSVIGREFPHTLLAAVAGLRDAELTQGLNELAAAGLLFRRGTPPDAEYTFKHALVQDAAYGTLLLSRRQQLHARIAVTIENQFVETATSQPELLAFHHQHAGNAEQSFRYWALAGDVCEQRGASSESVTHYRSACQQFDMPDPPDTIRLREPEINVKLGNALMQVEGYNSEEGRQAFGRARSAAARLELPEEYARAGIGVAPLLFGQCRYREVIDIGEDISRKLLEHLRPQTRVHLWIVLGVASYCIGDFTTALAYETRAAKLDDDVQCTHENPIGGGDPAVVCRGYAGLSCTALGLMEESVAWSEQAWAIANARAHAFSIAWAGLVRMCTLNTLGRDAESVDIGNVCVGICERHGFNARLGNLLVFRGAARLAIGERDEGLADMRRGMAIWRKTSGTFHLTQLISELVRCLLRLERTGEAEQALQEAEEIVGKTEEQSHWSEILRLRGQLHEAANEREQASVCYQRALEWSRAHHAKLFELRASTSLARLWRGEGRYAAARDLLAPVYGWFTGGFDAPDLKEAKALLDTI